MNIKGLEKLAGSLKKGIKETHSQLMSSLPKEEREKVQQQLNSMIDKAKADGNPTVNNFMKDIYGR